MRILLVTPGLGLGGSERLTLAYARWLVARGHEVLVVHGPPERFSPADVEGIPRRRLSGRPTARTFPDWFRSLRSIAREFRPDVAHTQSVRTMLMVASALPRTPLLTTVHGIEESEERAAALLLRAGRARVTAVSEASAEGVSAIAWRRASSWSSPASTSGSSSAPRWHAPATALPERAPRVVCVARHFPVKGVDVLVEAFPQVLAAIPGAVLVLVGGGPETDELTARVAELGITDAVHLAGRQLNPAPYLAAADLVVLPSRREGLPCRRSRHSRSNAPSWQRRSAARPTSCDRAIPAGSCRQSSRRRSPTAIVEALRSPDERAAAPARVASSWSAATRWRHDGPHRGAVRRA